jgi:hypothetical protein
LLRISECLMLGFYVECLRCKTDQQHDGEDQNCYAYLIGKLHVRVQGEDENKHQHYNHSLLESIET